MALEILADILGTNDIPVRVTRDRQWTELTVTVGPETLGFDYADDVDRAALTALRDPLNSVLDE